MNFRSYISISVVSHILLISLISILPSHTKIPASVFDVNIVTPFEKKTILLEKKEPPKVKNQAPPVIIKKPVLNRKKATVHPENDLKPDTMHEENTGPSAQKKDSPKSQEQHESPEKSDQLKEGDDIVSTQTKDIDLVPTNKEGLPIVPGSSLFDKKTIEIIARKGPPSIKGMTFDTSEFKHRGYMRLLKERIQSIWKYPKEAAKLGISGDLYIRFTIKKNGVLGKTEIVRTSGYRHLDKAVLKALKDAQPYWPLPEDWEKEDLEITGHFIYLYGDTLIF